MTDNGLAALATAIHVGRNHQHDPRADERPHAHLISEREQEEAAAILGPRGVFLPDGLGPVMLGMAEEIATLRAALEAIEDEHRADEHPEWAGWYDEPGECPDLACRTCGTAYEYAVHWPCDTAKIARAALAEAKETP